ncbi:sporozoite protein with an altered thrombospondin repeat SPATR [Besnoitia besnoiti]|uniref:Sporozoite protein with an altered thrombospondin repeat SPATR n=1 Tax=Besnoitia besnoiti TaxID=94643 RepID=A0A2A9M930_BESBE|nr:sporozoite protein with an altered thrombospondin repeat SPATR [Besnoitia besnoiti]PFH32406.1 sporozoite protein with an altered thrombospondin repeat SPATR [Besnoitia besnoiti]
MCVSLFGVSDASSSSPSRFVFAAAVTSAEHDSAGASPPEEATHNAAEETSETPAGRPQDEATKKALQAAEATADAVAKALEVGVPMPPLAAGSAGAAAVAKTSAKDATVATNAQAAADAGGATDSTVIRADDAKFQAHPEAPSEEHGEASESSAEEEKPIPADGEQCIIFAAEEGDPDSCSCPEGFVLCNWQDVAAEQARVEKIGRAAHAAAVRQLLLDLDKLPREDLGKAPASSATSPQTTGVSPVLSNNAAEPAASTELRQARERVPAELRGTVDLPGSQEEGHGGLGANAQDDSEMQRLEAMLPPELADTAVNASRTAKGEHAAAWMKALCDDADVGFKSYGVQIDYEIEVFCGDNGTKDFPDVRFVYDLNTYVDKNRLTRLQAKDSSWTPRHCLVADFYLCKRLPPKRKQVNCEMTGWSEWSTACVDNTQTRKRGITRSGQHGGRLCVWDGKQPARPEVTEVRPCSSPSQE